MNIPFSTGSVRVNPRSKSAKEKADEAAVNKELITRAKTILMAGSGMDEPEAYRTLKRLSMDRRKSLAQIAQTVILADELDDLKRIKKEGLEP